MRGGSQGLKNKNYRLINGKPLMYFTIKQAIKAKIFDHIVVSTDSKKILKIAKSYGADAWFLRPKKLASNRSQKVPSVHITLNYFTRKPTRQIFIDGKNISIQADLVKKSVICYDGKKKNSYNFKNSEKNSEYRKQHVAILTNKYTDKLCTFKEGKQLVYLINQIRSRSKK